MLQRRHRRLRERTVGQAQQRGVLGILHDRHHALPHRLVRPGVLVALLGAADPAARRRIDAEAEDALLLASAQSLVQPADRRARGRSEEHTSELQSLMRISYAVFCLKKKRKL